MAVLGYDLEMIRSERWFNCPFLALGGAGNWQHISELFLKTEFLLRAQNIFHFTEESINSAKFFKKKEINIRY